MAKPEIYVSTDVETNGPIPGLYSMLSIGSAAFLEDGTLVDTFSANLYELEGGQEDPDMMDWWATQPEAWAALQRDRKDPFEVMVAYVEWLDNLPGKPVFVGYPTGFDFTFVYWYLIRFVGRSPFGFSALDIKTLAMGVLSTGFRETSKRRMPREWFDAGTPHSHVAVEDAIEQGRLFLNILAASRKSRTS